MAAPSYAAKGTYLNGTAANAAVPLPAGIVANELVLVLLYIESTTTVTPPAGYTLDTTAAVTGVSAHTFKTFWHRATTTESGTASFTHASAYREALAFRVTGATTSGSPFDVASNTATTTTAGATTPAVTLTTAGADRLIVWAASNFDAGTWTPPSGFLEQHDSGQDVTLATVAQAVAGSTGSVSGGTTASASNGKTAYLAAILPDPGSAATQARPLIVPSQAAVQAGSW